MIRYFHFLFSSVFLSIDDLIQFNYEVLIFNRQINIYNFLKGFYWGKAKFLLVIRVPLFCALVSVGPFWCLKCWCIQVILVTSMSMEKHWLSFSCFNPKSIDSLTVLLMVVESCFEEVFFYEKALRLLSLSRVSICRQSLPTLDYYFEDAHPQLSVKQYWNMLSWFWEACFRRLLSIICSIP